jgi:predicted CopG family antitoxin
MTSKTTISIGKEIRKELQSHKKYQRETYDEILKRLMIKDKRSLKK